VTINHCAATALHFTPTIDGSEVASGAVVLDSMSGQAIGVRASVVVNATGPFCDAVRAEEYRCARVTTRVTHTRVRTQRLACC
jgi:glycerol-3-phosphate dehydrogenase